MEEKRINVMSVEPDDDFPEKDNKSTAVQKSPGSGVPQNQPKTGEVHSQSIGKVADNPATPSQSQASKIFPNFPDGTASRASENMPKTSPPASTPQNPQTPKDRVPQPASQEPAKSGNMPGIADSNTPDIKPVKRVRKKKPDPDMTAEEYRKILTDELAKKKEIVAAGKKDITTLTRELEALDENPDDFMASKRNLDSHCKILAGVAAITLYNSKSKEFTRETFREALNALLKKAADKKYFEENLHE